MKNLAILIVSVLLAFPFIAQDENADSKQVETLFSGEIESGGYGGVFIKFGEIYDGTGVFVGGQGGWVINHQLVIGGKGYGLANRTTVNSMDNVKLEFGCGGGFIEYMLASHKLINASVHTMIGAGGVNYVVDKYQEPHSEIDLNGDAFFVMEPGANLNLNVHDKFKIGIGATYRFVSGVDYDTLSDSDLSGFSGEFIIKFGSF